MSSVLPVFAFYLERLKERLPLLVADQPLRVTNLLARGQHVDCAINADPHNTVGTSIGTLTAQHILSAPLCPLCLSGKNQERSDGCICLSSP